MRSPRELENEDLLEQSIRGQELGACGDQLVMLAFMLSNGTMSTPTEMSRLRVKHSYYAAVDIFRASQEDTRSNQ